MALIVCSRFSACSKAMFISDSKTSSVTSIAVRPNCSWMSRLHEAKQVSVFSALEEGETGELDLDLAGALRWQGINAARLRPGTVAGSVGAEFLRTAAHQSATLLVMGAYTHRRLQQMLLGGVTRHVLRHGTLPVLMAH